MRSRTFISDSRTPISDNLPPTLHHLVPQHCCRCSLHLRLIICRRHLRGALASIYPRILNTLKPRLKPRLNILYKGSQQPVSFRTPLIRLALDEVNSSIERHTAIERISGPESCHYVSPEEEKFQRQRARTDIHFRSLPPLSCAFININTVASHISLQSIHPTAKTASISRIHVVFQRSSLLCQISREHIHL